MNRRATDLADTNRFAPREEEPWWMNALHWLMARKTLRKVLAMITGGGALGALVMWAIMFLTGRSDIAAVDREHRSMIAAQGAELAVTRALADTNRKRLFEVSEVASTILNAVCGDYTKAQQRARKMVCDPEIYRGAPGL